MLQYSLLVIVIITLGVYFTNQNSFPPKYFQTLDTRFGLVFAFKLRFFFASCFLSLTKPGPALQNSTFDPDCCWESGGDMVKSLESNKRNKCDPLQPYTYLFFFLTKSHFRSISPFYSLPNFRPRILFED